MNYEQYEYKIVLLHGVELRGWPKDLKFQSPSKIMNVPDLMKLRDALLAKTCRWVKLNREEMEEYQKKISRLEAEGVLVKKKRKGRADAGMKRKRGTGKAASRHGDETRSEDDDDGDDEDERNAATSQNHSQISNQPTRRVQKGRAKRVANSEEDDEGEGDGRVAKPTTQKRRKTGTTDNSNKTTRPARRGRPARRIVSDEFIDDSRDDSD